MSLPTKNDPYTSSGVDYSAMDPGKLRAQRAALLTAAEPFPGGLKEVAASRGESAYAVDFGDCYVTSVTEALGTKNLVADATRVVTGRSHYGDVARDAVAAILNDLATLGGEAVSLNAYWGVGSSDWFRDEARMADLVDGWAAACQDAHCAWGGGETQVLAGVIDPRAAVLAGSAVGRVFPKEHLLLGDRVKPGDSILIAPSTGIHANGLTLARRVADDLPSGYATPVPGDPQGRCFGEVLLDPAPLYGPLVHALQRADVPLHYAVHVTGHGWRKLMRSSQKLTYVIERLPEVNPIFALLCSAARMSFEDSYGTFNMGAGYALFVAQSGVELAQSVGRQFGFELLNAGFVEAGPRRVSILPLNTCFEGEALQIR